LDTILAPPFSRLTTGETPYIDGGNPIIDYEQEA